MPTSSGELLKDRSRDLVVAGYAIVQGTLWSRPVAGHCLYLIIVLHLAFLTAHFGFGLYKSVSQSSGQIVPRMLRIFGRIGGSHFGFEFGAFTTKLRQGGFENARSKTTFRSLKRNKEKKYEIQFGKREKEVETICHLAILTFQDVSAQILAQSCVIPNPR